MIKCLWIVLSLLLFSLFGNFGGKTIGADDSPCSGVTGWIVSESADLGVAPSQATAALPPVALPEGSLLVNGEIDRSVAGGVYARIAPATVLIYVGESYGTGFVVGEDGWILTNHHVVERAGVMLDTGIQAVKIYFGHLNDAVMTLDEQYVVAHVFKISRHRDLALLKLERLPKGMTRLPVVPLAAAPAELGTDCCIIGHPRAGLLWTVRSGEVAGIGNWPTDMIDTVMARLTMSGTQRKQFTQTLKAAAKYRVIITTCGVNPGDSGGPVVNAAGELIGVTFAIPKGAQESGISLDKFSYHVHLDEVKQFLADRPKEAPVYVPDWWPAATISELLDRNDDAKADTWLFGFGEGKPISGCLVDLDQDSPSFFKESFMKDASKRERWEAEFAYQRSPLPRTFYDTDNDGKIDLILTDSDGDKLADLAIAYKSGKWTCLGRSSQPLFDASLFEDASLGRRFLELVPN